MSVSTSGWHVMAKEHDRDVPHTLQCIDFWFFDIIYRGPMCGLLLAVVETAG